MKEYTNINFFWLQKYQFNLFKKKKYQFKDEEFADVKTLKYIKE